MQTHGPHRGDLLVLGWGSTFGPLRAAVKRRQARGESVAWAHLRHLHPLPANVGEVLARYKKILVPELNAGQLATLLRSRFPADVRTLSKLKGMPFYEGEIELSIEEHVG